MKDGPSPEEEEALIEAMIERDHHVHGLADEWEVVVEEVEDEVEEFVEHLHHLSDGRPVRRIINAVDEPASSYQQAVRILVGSVLTASEYLDDPIYSQFHDNVLISSFTLHSYSFIFQVNSYFTFYEY